MQTRISKEISGRNIYLNINMSNSYSSTVALPATISQNFQTSLIDNPSLYNLILTRFSVPGTSIPIYPFLTLGYPGTTDINLGIFSIIIGYNGSYSTRIYFEWQPETLIPPLISAFSAQSPNQDPFDPYYFGFSYQNIANMLTVGIRAAIASATLIIPGFPSDVDCYVIFNNNTGYFSFLGTSNMYHSQSPIDPLNVQLWFNTPILSFLTGFKTFFNAFNSASGLDILLLITNNLNNSSSTQDGFNPNIPDGYYQVQSEFENDASMESLSRILITSNNCGGVIPQNELTTISGISPTFLNVIADFVPLASTENGTYRSKFQYYAVSEFFRRTLTQTTPFLSIGLAFYWQTRAEPYLRPIYINPGDNLIVTFLFERKNLLP
jgi:hypothetical protein